MPMNDPMTEHPDVAWARNASDEDLALGIARALRDAFLEYNAQFRAVTRRAKGRFERRDWLGGQRDAAERVDLYDEHVKASVAHARGVLGPRAADRAVWVRAKALPRVPMRSGEGAGMVKTPRERRSIRDGRARPAADRRRGR